MNFPLSLTCKVFDIAPQMIMVDADGNNICYVRQKVMKIKEHVEVFTDSTKKQKICDIRTNKVLDFSATYEFFDQEGHSFGAVARKGMKSIWRANYDIMENGETTMKIREEKPWVKVIDGMLGEIPIIGAITGFILNPSYIITDAKSGTELVRIKKQPAFFQGKFSIDKLNDFDTSDEMLITMATIRLVQMERARG